MERRRIISAFVAILIVAGVAPADMAPTSDRDIAIPPPMAILGCPSLPSVDAPLPFVAVVVDVSSLPVGLSRKAGVEGGRTVEPEPLYTLADRQDSLRLCLYALFGLGLCRSALWVKKLSSGAIPGWYHDGGPFQVGHSFAISPDCLISAPVFCLVQPYCGCEPPAAPYHTEIIFSLLWKSEFAPVVLTARGPPWRACC